jgi:hypothetical protein
VSASTIVRSGYSLPIAMAQPIGGDLQPLEHRNSAIDFGWRPVLWDTQFQVVERLKTSGAVDVSIVGRRSELR